jgi:hypothetical protein
VPTAAILGLSGGAMRNFRESPKGEVRILGISAKFALTEMCYSAYRPPRTWGYTHIELVTRRGRYTWQEGRSIYRY